MSTQDTNEKTISLKKAHKEGLICLLVTVALVVLFASLFIAGCGASTKTGVLVGVRVGISLQDAIDQEIEDIDFGGVVIVELDDGSEVEALWDNNLGSELVGGMRLEIAPIEDSDYWKVVRIID